MIFAYLDAGSGSLLLQAILGGLAGVAVAARAWKARLSGRKMIEEAVAEGEGTTDNPVLTSEN
ncbi:MAG: hypothetical protein L0Z49_09180 [Actinobacteria bacterium]|nr:hypothetical protein [Actinomycetota bacterium]MCI0544597.1 hypothetical protein [Actinomycetota bacterium]MCI0678780.1 hypothetical protein [Actinomycetota bacterium]